MLLHLSSKQIMQSWQIKLIIFENERYANFQSKIINNVKNEIAFKGALVGGWMGTSRI
jgi:hypothetical protein